MLTSLRHAQALFALPGGVNPFELKVPDVFEAQAIAAEVACRTGLQADSWMTINAELLAGLSAQSTSKSLIQFFVVIRHRLVRRGVRPDAAVQPRAAHHVRGRHP